MSGERWDDDTAWKTRRQACVHCEAVSNAASNCVDPLDDDAPQPGDYSICLRCGGWMRFDERMMMRRLTLSELTEMRDTDEYRQTNEAWQRFDLLRQASQN
jgi:hypothetical protein